MGPSFVSASETREVGGLHEGEGAVKPAGVDTTECELAVRRAQGGGRDEGEGDFARGDETLAGQVVGDGREAGVRVRREGA